MAIQISKTWRIVMYNRSGGAIPANKVTVTLTPYTIVAGAQSFGSNVTVVAASDGSAFASTIADKSYTVSATVDNSSNGFLGGSMLIQVDLALATPAVGGWLIFYLQNSTDAGTTWPANGEGLIICPPENSQQTFNYVTAAVLKNVFVI